MVSLFSGESVWFLRHCSEFTHTDANPPLEHKYLKAGAKKAPFDMLELGAKRCHRGVGEELQLMRHHG